MQVEHSAEPIQMSAVSNPECEDRAVSKAEAASVPPDVFAALVPAAPHHGQSTKPSGITFEHALHFMAAAQGAADVI